MKPGTLVDVVEKYVDQVDLILVMTVEPGFGGQKFMETMMKKVEWLRRNFPTMDIEVDGGVGLSNIKACAKVRNYLPTFVICIYLSRYKKSLKMI